MRKACVEPIYFNKDGSIPEVEMTSQGAGKPLKAWEKVEAERACLLFGNTRIMDFDKNNEDLESIAQDDKAGYKYIDFGKGMDRFTCMVVPGSGGKIELLLDQPWGQSIGTLDIQSGGDGKKWESFTGKIKPVTGIHALWLKFSVKNDNSFKLDWFKFDNGQ